MGIRLNSAIAIGVQFTDKEARAFDKFMKGKGQDWMLMRWIETTLKKEFKMEGKEGRYIYSCHNAYKYAKRNKKGTCLKPYRPFWAGYSKKKVTELERCLSGKAHDYLISVGCPSEAEGLKRREMWFPYKNDADYVPKMLATVIERNHAREVDYGILDVLGIGHEGASEIITVKGSRPWECGTEQFEKEKNIWHTFNGQNMIPEIFLPKDKAADILHQILHHTGTKASFIKKKKEIWDLYHGTLKPYKIYPGEGWMGSDFNFYPIDTMYQLICEYIPEIKYDVMRIEKYLCFYWA